MNEKLGPKYASVKSDDPVREISFLAKLDAKRELYDQECCYLKVDKPRIEPQSRSVSAATRYRGY